MINIKNKNILQDYHRLAVNITIFFASSICMVYPALSGSQNRQLWLYFSVLYLFLFFQKRWRSELLLLLGTTTIFTMSVLGEKLSLQIWLLMPPLFSSVLLPGRHFFFHTSLSFVALLGINYLRFDEVDPHLLITCIGVFILTSLYSYLLSFNYIKGLEEIIRINKQKEEVQEEKLLLLEREQRKSFKNMARLAAGVSDEFGILIGAISTSNQALKELVSSGPIQPEKIDKIAQTNDSILQRSDELLKMFAKPDYQSTTDMLDLREILNTTLVILRGHLLEEVELIDNLGDRPLVIGSRETIASLFMNLIKNSVEANASSISISFQHIGSRRELLIEDNGVGIPPDMDVFKPFVTSMETGTGIGMHFIRERLAQMNAEIEVERRQNPTVIKVTFRDS